MAGEGRSLYFHDHDNHLFELHTGTLEERLARYGARMVDSIATAALEGRVVARFRTDPAEIAASGTAFAPPLHFAMPFGKAGLYAFGLVLGVLIAFGRDYLPGWPDWLSTALFSVVVGMLLSTLLWIALGRRNQRLLAAIGGRRRRRRPLYPAAMRR